MENKRKMLSGRTNNTHKKVDEWQSKTKIFELLDQKFRKDACEEEKSFLQEFMDWMREHDEKARECSTNYFKKNKRLNFINGLKAGVNGVVKMGSVVFLSFGGTVLVQKLLELLGIEQERLQLLMFIVFVSILLAEFLVLVYRKNVQNELHVRKYGETWVRHRTASARYQKEILSYICEIGVYYGKDEKEQKRIFIERVLENYTKNIAAFEENMKEVDRK